MVQCALPGFGIIAEILHLQQNLPLFLLSLLDSLNIRPDHHSCNIADRYILSHRASGNFSAAQRNDAIRDLHDLPQLVGDEYHRLPVGGQLPDGIEKLGGLLRGQHRSRLVQNQDLRFPVEGLDDLYPLHFADAQFADRNVQGNLNIKFLLQLGNLLIKFGRVPEKFFSGVISQHDILRHGQGRGEHKVLVNHTDPQCDRITGRTKGNGLPTVKDLPLIGLQHPVHDIHQCGFPRAVFTYQRYYLSFSDAKADIVIRNGIAKSLGNPLQFEFTCSRHHMHLLPGNRYGSNGSNY